MGSVIAGVLGAVLNFTSGLITNLFSKKEEQLAGQNTQALADAQVALQADKAAQQVATSVDGLSHSQLVDELRRPSAPGH